MIFEFYFRQYYAVIDILYLHIVLFLLMGPGSLNKNIENEGERGLCHWTDGAKDPRCWDGKESTVRQGITDNKDKSCP